MKGQFLAVGLGCIFLGRSEPNQAETDWVGIEDPSVRSVPSPARAPPAVMPHAGPCSCRSMCCTTPLATRQPAHCPFRQGQTCRRHAAGGLGCLEERAPCHPPLSTSAAAAPGTPHQVQRSSCIRRLNWNSVSGHARLFFFGGGGCQTEMSWRSLLTSQYSR